MKKKSLLKDQTGAIPWVKLVVMVVVVAAAGIAALMIYKPKIPTTEPAAVRAKVPPTPVTHAIPVPQEQPDATAEQQPAAAAAPDQSPPVAPLTQEDEADSSPDPALPREETEPSPREIGTVNPSPESDPASTPDDAEPAAAQEPSVPPIQPYEERTPTAGDSAPDEPQAALPAQVGSPPEPQPTAAPLRETASDTPTPQPDDAPDTDVQEQADDAQEDESQARFTIQMGAFRNESFANKAMADMQQRGYPAYVHQYSDEDQRPFYLVRFGRFYTLDDASAAMDDFKDREQMPAVIARIGEK